MKQSLNQLLSALLIAILASNANIFGCMTTIFNDGPSAIMIIDHNASGNKKKNNPQNIIFIPKNTSRRFGKAHEHGNFTIYTKQKNGNSYTATYHAQQNECDAKGNPFIKMSDIKNRTGQTSLFTITDISTPHTSMVRELPSLQRPDIFKQEANQGCSACSAHK